MPVNPHNNEASDDTVPIWSRGNTWKMSGKHCRWRSHNYEKPLVHARGLGDDLKIDLGRMRWTRNILFVTRLHGGIFVLGKVGTDMLKIYTEYFNGAQKYNNE